MLFTDNATNYDRLLPGRPNENAYVKDGINNFVVEGNQAAVNPEKQGTKVSAHYRLIVEPGQSATVRVRLTAQAAAAKRGKNKSFASNFGTAFDNVISARLKEADEFYASVIPPSISPDAASVMRQALAGMLWSKQFYFFDGDEWLEEHNANPLHAGSRDFRNREWFHMVNKDIISMPDKWEYPWYAAWDLAFHTLPLSIVDPDFAKQQMELMLRGVYLHPSGQMPAYEWNFSDVNPPVHAFATLFLNRTEQTLRGETDVNFLKAAFNKLLLNFTWWVNRKDRFGKNVFEGGFLGLDNIGIFDRSAPLPTGGHLEQADGTAWMALFSQNMMELAFELAAHDRTYEDMVRQVRGAFRLYRLRNEPARSERHVGRGGWLLLRPAEASRRQFHAAQGAIHGRACFPICATTVIEKWQRDRSPRGMEQMLATPETDAGASGIHARHRPGPLRRRRKRDWWLLSTRRGFAEYFPRCSMRMNS